MKTGSTSQHFLASFESREAVDDGFGNTVSGPFTERFQEMAAFIYGGGSEGATHCFTAGGTVLNALGSDPIPFLVALRQAAQR